MCSHSFRVRISSAHRLERLSIAIIIRNKPLLVVPDALFFAYLNRARSRRTCCGN
jgi:ABC-type uncharacterized transport system permease subunit